MPNLCRNYAFGPIIYSQAQFPISRLPGFQRARVGWKCAESVAADRIPEHAEDRSRLNLREDQIAQAPSRFCLWARSCSPLIKSGLPAILRAEFQLRQYGSLRFCVGSRAMPWRAGRQSLGRKVLLVPHALIGGYEDLVALLLRQIDKVSVIQVGPAFFRGCIHRVSGEMLAERHWRTLIEQNFHDFTGVLRALASC